MKGREGRREDEREGGRKEEGREERECMNLAIHAMEEKNAKGREREEECTNGDVQQS